MDILGGIVCFFAALAIVFVFTALASDEQTRLTNAGHEKLGMVVYYTGLVSGLIVSFLFIYAVYK